MNLQLQLRTGIDLVATCTLPFHTYHFKAKLNVTSLNAIITILTM